MCIFLPSIIIMLDLTNFKPVRCVLVRCHLSVSEISTLSALFKEGRTLLFNDALNIFYLQLYGIKHIAREETRCHHMGYSFQLAGRVLLDASCHIQDNTYHIHCCTSCITFPSYYYRGKSVRSWRDRSLDRSFMVDPLSYFSFQPVLHDWCNKGCCMYYPVYRMVHIKEPFLLIGKSSPCGGIGVSSLSLSEWSFTICVMPYNHK